MNSITIKEKNPALSNLIDQINESHQPTLVTVDDKKAVLISLEEWNSIAETLYLLSIPGVKEDLMTGKNTAWEDCTPIEELKW
ncbi:MAG TPA: type II toxin-antitoxin system Phd/YefM family antitoxin [Allocoleopsis sp.]